MTSFKKNDFLENAKFMSGLANGYFLFEKKGILIMSLFSCCLSRVFMTVEQEYTSLNAQMDEVWSGIVWMTSLRDSFKKPKLKTILVLKYLHTKLVYSCTMSYLESGAMLFLMFIDHNMVFISQRRISGILDWVTYLWLPMSEVRKEREFPTKKIWS